MNRQFDRGIDRNPALNWRVLAVLNLYFGLMGVFYLLREGNMLEFKFSFIIFLLNLTWAGIIVYAQLRPPGVEHSSA